MRLKNLSNLLLITFFAMPFFTQCVGSYYLPGFSTLINWLQRLLCLILLFKGREIIALQSKKYKYFLIAFIVYMTFVFIYIGQGKIPISSMLGVPEELNIFILMSASLFLLLLCVPIIAEYADYYLLSIAIIVFTLLASILYFLKVDYTLYFLQLGTGDILDLDLIHPFMLSSYAASGVFAVFIIKARLSKYFCGNILSYLLLFLFFLLIVVSTKRGPIVYIVMSLMLYFFIQNKLSKKSLYLISIGVLFYYFFGSDLLKIASSIFPDIVERFIGTEDDGGSGRFGDPDSLYNIAWRQIMDSPIWGSHMRIFISSSTLAYGSYPHNFFLELAMTMGIPITIVFCILLYKIIRQYLKYSIIDRSSLVIFLISIYSVLLMMTTGTILLNINFWAGFAILSSFKYFKQ